MTDVPLVASLSSADAIATLRYTANPRSALARIVLRPPAHAALKARAQPAAREPPDAISATTLVGSLRCHRAQRLCDLRRDQRTARRHRPEIDHDLRRSPRFELGWDDRWSEALVSYFVTHPLPGKNIAYEIHPHNRAGDFDPTSAHSVTTAQDAGVPRHDQRRLRLE